MLRLFSAALIVFLLCGAVAASTQEAKTYGFWTEFDIIFWQTAPFAVFWGYAIDTQLSSILSIAGAPHWNTVVASAILISSANAYFHAKR